MWADIYITGAIIFFSNKKLTDMHRLRLIDSKNENVDRSKKEREKIRLDNFLLLGSAYIV
jgi:hypothetical protein